MQRRAAAAARFSRQGVCDYPSNGCCPIACRQDPLLSRSAALYLRLCIPAMFGQSVYEASKRYLLAQGVVHPQVGGCAWALAMRGPLDAGGNQRLKGPCVVLGKARPPPCLGLFSGESRPTRDPTSCCPPCTPVPRALPPSPALPPPSPLPPFLRPPSPPSPRPLVRRRQSRWWAWPWPLSTRGSSSSTWTCAWRAPPSRWMQRRWAGVPHTHSLRRTPCLPTTGGTAGPGWWQAPLAAGGVVIVACAGRGRPEGG